MQPPRWLHWDRSEVGRALLRNPGVSVVIPALNEAASLPFVLSRIPLDVQEVILVDGASTDGTVEVARQVRNDIRVVSQDAPGKGAALRAGFMAARGDIVVHLDADGSTDPNEIPVFVACLLTGADYAKGTRFAQGASSTDITVVRRLGNWMFVTLTNLLFRTKYTDITYGYNATWKRHSDKLALEIDGWANEIISNIRVARHGLRVVEVASQESPRIAGEAKLRAFPAGWAILRAIVAERLRNPNARPIGPGYGQVEQPTVRAIADGRRGLGNEQLRLVEDLGMAADESRLRPVMLRFDDHHNGQHGPLAGSEDDAFVADVPRWSAVALDESPVSRTPVWTANDDGVTEADTASAARG